MKKTKQINNKDLKFLFKKFLILAIFKVFNNEKRHTTIFYNKSYTCSSIINKMDADSWEVFESVFSDKLYKTSSEVHSLACNNDIICAGLRSGQIQIFDLNTDADNLLNAHTQAVNTLHLTPSKLISGGQDSIIIIWDLATKSQIASLPGHSGVITSVSALEDFLYTTSIDQTIKK